MFPLFVSPYKSNPLPSLLPEFVYRITRKLMFALPTITTTVENYCELRVMDFNGCWWWAKALWMGDLVMKIEVMALRLTLIQFKLVSHLKMIWEILHLWILGIFRIFMVSNHHKNHFWSFSVFKLIQEWKNLNLNSSFPSKETFSDCVGSWLVCWSALRNFSFQNFHLKKIFMNLNWNWEGKRRSEGFNWAWRSTFSRISRDTLQMPSITRCWRN